MVYDKMIRISKRNAGKFVLDSIGTFITARRLFTKYPCEMPQTKGIFLKDELIDKSTLMREDVKLKKDESEKNVISIVNSIKIERNFDHLTTINISDSVVEKVLLELKEPTGAKQALSFFYWCVRSKNHVHSVRCYCIIVEILVRAKLLAHAQVLLESAIIKNEREDASELKIADIILSTYKITQSIPFVFNSWIQTYAKLRMFELAFDACRHLHEQGFPSSVISYNTMIRYAEKSNKCPLIWKIYEYMIAKRIYPNQDTVKILVNVMCKEGTLQKSISILDKIHGRRCVPAIIVNTCLIFRIFKEKRVEEGITLVKRMLQKNLILDDIANSLIIHGYCLKGNLDMAHELYGEMIKKGISTNAFLFTSFIGQHCANKRIEEAQCLVQQMQEAGMMMYDDTYNSLVEGFCKDGRIEEGLAFYKEMLAKGLVPGDIVVDILIRKLCEIGEVEMLTAF